MRNLEDILIDRLTKAERTARYGETHEERKNAIETIKEVKEKLKKYE